MSQAVWAVIVAAGAGERFGGPLHKPFVLVGERPLLWYSARTFARHPRVGGVVLVVQPGDAGRAHAVLAAAGLRGRALVVCGGPRRQDSVRAGCAILPAGTKWVLIHDAARPLISSRDITRVLRGARRSGAAILASRVVETAKREDGRRRVLKTVPREGLWTAQTPQAFARAVLDRGFARAGAKTATDEAMMVEAAGVKVALVEGSRWNIKVTLPGDVAVVRAVLAAGLWP